jgi:uncharacterized protein (DUF433 family)
VGDTRITLEVVIGAYQRGDSVEAIVQGFPSLGLAEVHALIAYYLANRAAVDEYIRQVDQEGAEIRRKFEALDPDQTSFRERLLARREAQKPKPE